MTCCAMMRLAQLLALSYALLHVTSCLGEDTREDAFINYREVSRTDDDLSPNDVAGVALVSSYGQVRLVLRRDWAPKACQAVAGLAAGAARACPGCSFYRHEPVPENWGVNGYMGPPYSLLQGGLPPLDVKVDVENDAQRPVRRGDAAFIGGTTDFFIGTADHQEWGGYFTVFATAVAEDMVNVVARIPVEPYRNSTDGYNITTRWLLQHVPFSLQPLRAQDLPARTDLPQLTVDAEAVARL